MAEKRDESLNEQFEDRPLTLENWNDFAIDDLPTISEDERRWNRFVVLKQAEINTMVRLLPDLRKDRIGSLCTAVDGKCDPLPD